jgi:hypothetical protein
MLGSIYYLIIFMDKKTQRQVILSMIFAMLALYSNFVLMYYFISLIAAFNFLFITDFHQSKKRWKGVILQLLKKNLPIIIITVATLLISYEPIRKLVKFNELYGRGVHGFWLDTVLTFVHGSFYGVDYHYDLVRLFMFFTMLMIAIAIVVFFLDYRKSNNTGSKSNGIVFLMILIFPALATVFQHLLMGSEYLLYRTTLFFHPLLALTLVYLIYITIQKKKIKFAAYLLSIIIAFSMMFHFVKALNFEYVYEWKYEAGTKKMISDLERVYIADALTNRNTPAHIDLGINWLFEPTINYYRITKNLKWLNEVNRNGFVGNFNYYYVFTEDTTGLNLKKVINTYKASNTLLAK